MQGIISAAMCHQLLLMGLRPVFDAVYGASAGALNASFFLATQPRGLDIYTEELVDGNFLDLTQMLPKALQILASRKGPGASSSSRYAMDLDYLFDHVMQNKIPLDYKAVISSPIPLKVVVSSLDDLKPLILDNFTSAKDLAECLAASCAVPEVAGPPRLVRGHRCVDAAVFEPVPVASAIRDGCTHILVLSTRTSASIAGGSRAAPMARAGKRAVIAAVKKTLLNAPYMRDAWSCGYSSTDGSDEEILNARESGQAHRLGAYVYGVYPRSLRGVHPICTDVATLRAARAEGYQSVRGQIGRPLGLRRKQLSKVLVPLTSPQDLTPSGA
jgi:predicted patatin/cPLA2 family phospholipase